MRGSEFLYRDLTILLERRQSSDAGWTWPRDATGLGLRLTRFRPNAMNVEIGPLSQLAGRLHERSHHLLLAHLDEYLSVRHPDPPEAADIRIGNVETGVMPSGAAWGPAFIYVAPTEASASLTPPLSKSELVDICRLAVELDAAQP